MLDAIIVGGGLAGCAVADQLARFGASVVVLERETTFKDRVRGENMLPWGVAAARRLGIYDDLIAAGGHPVRNFLVYTMGQAGPPRDLVATTPGGAPALDIFHPDMQEAVLARARRSGADVRRGATVLALDAGPGRSPSVTYEQNGARETLTARIVIGADGRASQMRAWAQFDVQRNPELLTIAGNLIQGTSVPDDSMFLAMGAGSGTFWAPLGGGRSRTYFVYPGVAGRRGLTGRNKIPEFIDSVRAVGIPESWVEGVESIGPLAEFEGADRWVPSPVRNGVALVGDAAASSDPSWGCGLSLTLTDVEHLANALRSTSDWDEALSRYAAEHDEYYGALHRVLGWMTELSWTAGREADERRARVFPRWNQDPTGFPDAVGLGPFGPSDERARRLILGLD
jgi:2-polyprenyl-6-methoxyphenol hydroxylase-like FAD-dependent oxidoreductase